MYNDLNHFAEQLRRSAFEKKQGFKRKPAEIKGTCKKTKGGYLINRNGKPIRKYYG